jgi:hypothetical protein
MRHIALLGDSIFDNAAYTRGAPDVVTHLRTLLSPEWSATLCAVDGATTTSLEAQLARVPENVSHVIVSIGGNDALQNTDLLSLRVTSASEALEAFAERMAEFETRYRQAIEKVIAPGRRTAVCTVYNGAFEQDFATAARVGLTLFNDVILRTAIDLNLCALELRSVCTEFADYTNAIEPSGRGGLKIAKAIAHMVGTDRERCARIWRG